MPEFVVAYEITRTFTDEEMAHNPDYEEVMAIFVRAVEDGLRTVWGLQGEVTFKRLLPTALEGWT